jgi:alkylresorcinol/alkylpyrone synthase
MAGLEPADIDYLLFTSVTGIAAPSIDARLVPVLGLRTDIKRMPSFGLGCVAGAAGWLACTTTCSAIRRARPPGLGGAVLAHPAARRRLGANFVASGLFGDGAAAVVVAGDRRAAELGLPGPEIVGTRTQLYPDSESVIGWDIGGTGFRIVLTARSPTPSTRTSATTSVSSWPNTTWGSRMSVPGWRIPAARACWRRSSAD